MFACFIIGDYLWSIMYDGPYETADIEYVTGYLYLTPLGKNIV